MDWLTVYGDEEEEEEEERDQHTCSPHHES